MIKLPKSDWKSWRRAVRRKIRTSDDLRRAYKAQRPNRKIKYAWQHIRFVVPVSLLVMIFGVQQPVSHVLSLLLVWTCLVTVVRAQQFVYAFHNQAVLLMPFSWPVSDDEAFAFQRRQVTKTSWWLVLDWLIFGFAVAIREGDALLAWVTPFLALAQWAASLAVALWAVRWFPRFPYTWLSAPGGLLVLVVLRGANKHDSLTPYLENLWRAFFVLTPAGWLGQIWLNISDGNTVGYALLFVALALAILLWSKAWQATRAIFDLDKIFGYEPNVPEAVNAVESAPLNAVSAALSTETSMTAPAVPVGDAVDALNDANSAAAADNAIVSTTAPVPDLAEAALNCRTRAAEVFAQPAGMAFRDRGAVERVLGRFLNARERALIDILMPLGYRWSRRWAIAFGLVLVLAVVRQIPEAGTLVINVLIGGVLVTALPAFGGRWLGFMVIQTFQTQAGLCVHAPAGFWEISRVVLKLNALLCVAGLPFILLAGLVGISSPNADFLWLFDFCLRVLLIALGIQPIWLLCKLSPSTNDSTGPWYYLTCVCGAVVVLLILLITLFSIGLMAESSWVSLACLAGGLSVTHACLLLYGTAWNRGWFDLLAKQK